MTNTEKDLSSQKGMRVLTDKIRIVKSKPDIKSGKIKDNQRYMKIKIIILLMGIVMSISAVTVIMYSDLINDIKSIGEASVNEYKEEQFDHLWGIINEKIRYSAKNNITIASQNIEKDIRNMDLDTLKTDLDNREYPDELVNVFKKHLEDLNLNGIDNGKNNTLVLSNDHIILNYSYYAYPNDAEDSTLFSSIIMNGYNPELNQNALDHIYKQDNDIICIEVSQCENPNHIKIVDSSKESFEKVFMEEGIEGFKNYQFLVPIYITETGDVFGQNDIVNGERKDYNHKFIIIQEFNLYDQINLFSESFDSNAVDKLENEHNKIIERMYVFGIVFIILLIIVLFNFVSVYNNFIYGYMLALKQTDDNNYKEKSK